jgi:hypothetical protein
LLMLPSILVTMSRVICPNPDGHPNSPTYGHVKLPHLS